MALTDTASPVLADVLNLAQRARPAWDDLSAAIPSWHPRNEGEEGSGEGAGESDADKAAAAAEAAKGGGGGEEGEGKPAGGAEDKTDWKAMARKHEREAKKAKAERDAHAATIAAAETANLTEQQAAIKTAREEARTEADTEHEKVRRADKLELAVTRIAASKGVTIGEGDKAKTVKFADPDDVQMWVERQIAKGDIDADDIYKDGKVDADVLTEALTGLATSKPGWLVGAAAPSNGTPAGSVDAGVGASPKGASSVEDDLRAIQKHKT